MTSKFSYLGCKADKDSACAQCGTTPEIVHSLEATDGTHHKACCDCAEKLVMRGQGGMPTACETWSKSAGGQWYSRWHAEEFNR